MPADNTFHYRACLFKYRLFVLTVRTLYFEKFTPVFPNLAYHYPSLRQFKLSDPVTLAQVCLSAGNTAVPHVYLFCGLIATGHF
jgi:hypothetical protein